MAHITADRVRDTSTTTGTGNFTVSGSAQSGYRTFSAVLSVSDTFYYAIQHQTANEWEVGLGTYSSANTIARTTVLSSSNAGSAVNFSAGTKDVFITLAATRTIQLDNDGDVIISANSASDALRITQTGTGNALLVEDSANPDATPFAVNNAGQVLIGSTTAPFGSTTIGLFSNTVDAVPPYQDFFKNRAGAIVASGDVLGRQRFWGYDGAAYLESARIDAVVDTTPGSNDMPGSLRFYTTADGASSTLERMRIDNAGRIGFNSTSLGGPSGHYRFAGNITGAASSSGIVYSPSIRSDVTSAASVVSTLPSTQDAAFTLTTLQHFVANQGTITGGSRTAPTSQYGFVAQSTLTGATNNYGFLGNIASGTGRWNFYAAGTADNYFAGNVGIGTSSPGGYKLNVSGQALVTSSVVTNSDLQVNPSGYNLYLRNIGGTNRIDSYNSPITATVPLQLNASQMTFLIADAEKMRIDSSGNVGIGTSSPAASLSVVKQTTALSGTGNAYGLYMYPTSSGLTYIDAITGSTGNTSLGFRTYNNGTYNEMRMDSSGNVGIGTSSPAKPLSIQASEPMIQLVDADLTTRVANIGGQNGNVTIDIDPAATAASSFFSVNIDNSERARIDSSGNLLVGTTSVLNLGKFSLAYDASSQNGATFKSTSGTYNYNAFSFRNASGTEVGYIALASASTTYSTTSDYRLKKDVQPLTSGLATISALKPVTYKWKEDDSYGEGFIAHEAQEVVPLAVTRKKDEIDASGNILPQGVDYSKIVVHLVAAIQELKAQNDELKARVAALENA